MTSLKIGNGSVELSYMRGSEKGSDVISKLATGSAQKQPFFKTCSLMNLGFPIQLVADKKSSQGTKAFLTELNFHRCAD